MGQDAEYGLYQLQEKLSEAKAEIEKQRELHLRVRSLAEKQYEKDQKQLLEATEKYDHAMIELRSYDQILDEKNNEIEELKESVRVKSEMLGLVDGKSHCVYTTDEIQSLKDENKKFREVLEYISINYTTCYCSEKANQALTQKAEDLK